MDWIYGLIGGLMIGAAAALFLLGSGRIMGASGLLGGLVDRTGRSNWAERAVFLAALIGVPAVLAGPEAATHLNPDIGIVVLAGLLVGFGTRLANGCTSGHGVCGISRFSVRGIVATICYLAAGALTVFIFRHILGWI